MQTKSGTSEHETNHFATFQAVAVLYPFGREPCGVQSRWRSLGRGCQNFLFPPDDQRVRLGAPTEHWHQTMIENDSLLTAPIGLIAGNRTLPLLFADQAR